VVSTDKPKSKGAKNQPIYMRVKKLVDPETGQLVGALVPDSWASKNVMRERKLRTGDVARVTFTVPRNSGFFRMVHQLGTVVKNNIPEFKMLNSHEAIKRLQRESGVMCDVVQINAEPVVNGVMAAAQSLLGDAAAKMLGAVLPEIKLINVLEPKSLAFDSMDETQFREFWGGICYYLIETYWRGMTVEKITEMSELMPSSEGV
jgi:hypothetical protein